MPEYYEKKVAVDYIKCCHCGNTERREGHREEFDEECYICKKEGCNQCLYHVEWHSQKYKYHKECETKLLLKFIRDIKIRAQEDADDEQHAREYSMDHIS